MEILASEESAREVPDWIQFVHVHAEGNVHAAGNVHAMIHVNVHAGVK